jgi:mannose-6-phosphate isomerase-like protein (cupin superfamily)
MKEQIRKYDPNKEYFIEEQCHINELSNIPEDNDVSIAQALVSPGVTTHWHRLNGIVERYVIIRGQGKVEIGILLPQNISPGDIVIIPAGCRQRITNISTEDLVFLAICSPRFNSSAYEELNSEVLKCQ